jgi:hypothetical protein
MNAMLATMTPAQFAALGGGALAYIKEIGGKDAVKLLGPAAAVPPEAKLFCLYNADGTPISISGSREAAVGSAFEHEMVAASLH